MTTIAEAVEGRHPGTQHAAHFFAYEHLAGPHRPISKSFHDLAVNLIQWLNDGPELVAGLRKLREAKDCMVLQSVIDQKERP